MASIDDLKMDAEEMEKMVNQAARQHVKGILTIELHKMRTHISKLMDEAKSKESEDSKDVKPKPTEVSSRRYTKSITNYAWDQSEKFMKIYIALNGVQGAEKENITSEFTDSTFKVHISDLNSCDHQCHIVKLFEDIIPEKSYHKVKTDTILVMLKKKSEKTWAFVTQQEAKTKDKRPPMGAVDADADPQANMMKMMQQMYEDGDDEMKRTIAKSMYESQNKKTAVDL